MVSNSNSSSKVKEITVKKRNGQLEPLDVNKINKVVERCCKDLEGVSVSEIVLDAHVQLYNKVLTSDIDKALILSAAQKIEKEPNYSYAASRLLLNSIYKEVFKEGNDDDLYLLLYRKAFIKNIKYLVKKGRLSSQLLNFNLQQLSEVLQPSRDLQFKYHSLQNLYDRYFIKLDGKVWETPQAFYMRVAMGLALAEEKEKQQEVAINLYHLYSNQLVSPSTPTLFNSGTPSNQLASCFLTTFEDSLDGIFDGLWQEARKSKYAGGLGMHISSWRSSQGIINSSGGKSSGPIPFLKIYNDMLIAVNQSGRRPGAGCAVMENWHLDVEEFIDLRKNTGEERRRTHDLNTALWVSDLFMQRVEEDGDWYLFCPKECGDLVSLYGEEFTKRYQEYEYAAENKLLKIYKKIKAKDLWKKMLASLFSTSHPWIGFKDTANKRNSQPQVGPIYGSNLCTEIYLPTIPSQYENGVKTKVGESAVCVLHSINIARHLNEKNKIQWDTLRESIHLALRALDNATTLNFYPTEESRAHLKHRPVGLGLMGMADVYYRLDIRQDSDEGVAVAHKIQEFILYCALEASTKLARERGKYESFEGSLWDQGILPQDTFKPQIKIKGEKLDLSHTKFNEYSKPLNWDFIRARIKEDGLRMSHHLAIAPTASISYQHGVEQSIEPNFAVLFVYENISGNFYIINEHFVRDMKKEGIWSEEFAAAVKAVDGDVSRLNIPEKYKLKYATAFNRDQFKLIEATALRQKFVDQGISFNLYNKGTSLKFLNDIYFHTWKCGLKHNYYLRNLAATTVQKSTVETTSIVSNNKEQQPSLCSLEAKARGEICESCQ